MTVVFVDTTELFKAPRLDRGGWPQLLAWSRRGAIVVAVSEVVVREAVRHFTRDAAKRLSDIRKAIETLNNHVGLELHTNDHQAEAKFDRKISEYEQWLRNEFDAYGVQVMPLPAVSHDRLVERDLAVRKPFRENGKGYRDALNWESILEYLDDRAYDDFGCGEEVIVVSSDADFASSDSRELDLDLLEELSSYEIEPVLLHSISAVVQRLRAEVELALGSEAWSGPELALHEAVLSAVAGLAKDLGASQAEFESLFPTDFMDATVADVDVDEDSLALDVYDRYEGETLAIHAEIRASLTFEGFMRKADYYANYGEDDCDEDVIVNDYDWNDHIMSITVEREVLLRFYVTTVGQQIEDITFDSLESI